MKKLSIMLALLLVLSLALVACGGEPAAPAKFKVGMGAVVSPSLSDATADKAGQVQMNTTMAVVALDAEGKVVSVSFDVAQQALKVNADGTTADAAAVDTRTKIEKEGDYGMAGASAIGKELFEQVNAMEDWMVGKTVDEVLGMELGENSAAHANTPVGDLAASCTITVTDYLAAFKKAVDSAVEVEGLAKAGIGQNISVKGTAATADKKVQFRLTQTWLV